MPVEQHINRHEFILSNHVKLPSFFIGAIGGAVYPCFNGIVLNSQKPEGRLVREIVLILVLMESPKQRKNDPCLKVP